MMRYESDLSDGAWEFIKKFVEQGKMGRKRVYSTRDIVNGILYLTKTGCQWRLIPKDFPPYTVLFYHFQKWTRNGIWLMISDALVLEKRLKKGRNPEPTYGIIDSKSVPTASDAECKGFDGGKKVKGRKRHFVTDTQGHLLSVSVHAANIHDTKAGVEVLKRAIKRYPSLKAFCGDAGYRSTTKKFAESQKKDFHISEKIQDGWAVVPFRWVVERAFAHQQSSRRLSKDYEKSCSSSETMNLISHIQLMLKRLFSFPCKMFSSLKRKKFQSLEPPFSHLQQA